MEESAVARLQRRFDHLVLNPQKVGVVVFRCPVCGSTARTDGAGLEPVCTGPGWRDEHPHEPMVRIQ